MPKKLDYKKLLDETYAKLNAEKGASTDERFTIPEAEVLTEGNKTVFKNFQSYCEKIRRDPNFVAKFISREFGAPAKTEGDRLVIQRRIRPEMLTKKMQLFIDYYVICKECGKPDTKIVSMEGIQYIVCEACGARRPLKK